MLTRHLPPSGSGRGSIRRHAVKLATTVKEYWIRACVEQGIDPDSRFVAFDESSNTVRIYNRLVIKLQELRADTGII